MPLKSFSSIAPGGAGFGEAEADGDGEGLSA